MTSIKVNWPAALALLVVAGISWTQQAVGHPVPPMPIPVPAQHAVLPVPPVHLVHIQPHVQPAVIKPAPTKPIEPFPVYYPAREFDHPYTGKLTIITAESAEDVQKACRDVPAVLGCSSHPPGACLITLAPESVIKAYGWTKAEVLRHEIAHCNGWHADHRSWRRYDN